ncbi:DMT family transporter [Aestuariirhabdus sp. Z084]|uniref:DMT family transporter n=1 Tax=Aestuariirhabdus haliotis TaxID=2918751 RepID=UPI00201B4598|nr:DMT family transporter [Aestuariirhabdus haliotis]MCL6417735.1 DMT family transporter [Aestuariirhabdus haliotis]MCL6421674.1 DMT family transporter [Aestuariirhabdus haliotis]
MLNNLIQRFPTGVRFMLLSALGFALMAVCVKAASGYGIPVLEIVAARALVSLGLSYLDIRRKRLSPWGQHHGLLFARGAVGALALVCVYYAVTTLPLATATLLQYLHPAFTAVLAWLFLRERIRLATLLCIVLSMTGLLLISKPGLIATAVPELPMLSLVAALCGAFGSAIAYVLVRRLSRVEDSSVIIFYFPLIALPLSLVLLGGDFVMPSAEAAGLMLLVGIFTQVGQVGLTRALQTEEAGRATAFSYVQVVFAFVLGWVFFDELPTLVTWLGGGLIILGALLNAVWKR